MDIGKIYGTFMNIYTKPTETFKGLKKASMADGILAVVLGALVPAVIFAIIMIAFGAAFGSVVGFAGLGAGLGVVMALFMIIIYPIMAVIGWLIGGIIMWVIAKVMGGKGELDDFLPSYGYLTGALLVLIWIPLINFVVAIYGLYLLYVMLQPSMKMTSDKAALTIVVTIIIGFVLYFLIGAAVMAMMLGAAGTGASVFPGLGF